ncbi:cupin domain-containing protein [Paenibacillus guangzhouensis]|uniref:hypothetical protein n=1 Tax=Paenibacillus guangzhouensis TaxID=1473112 RepID=UPI001266AE6A|nr:hypothetical protein [Paenibacillus guangzhouensis]
MKISKTNADHYLVNGELFQLDPQEGIEVPPHIPHQIFNRSNADMEFLVISQPTSAGDRVVVEGSSEY